MKIYFIVCLVMLVLVYIRIAGEVIAFRKKYPGAVFKKSNFCKFIADLAKLIITFSVPLVNLLVFWGVMFKISDAEIEDIIKSKCEVYQYTSPFAVRGRLRRTEFMFWLISTNFLGKNCAKLLVDIYPKMGYTMYRKRGNEYAEHRLNFKNEYFRWYE